MVNPRRYSFLYILHNFPSVFLLPFVLFLLICPLQNGSGVAIIKVQNIYLSFSFSYLSFRENPGIDWSSIPGFRTVGRADSQCEHTSFVVVTALGPARFRFIFFVAKFLNSESAGPTIRAQRIAFSFSVC